MTVLGVDLEGTEALNYTVSQPTGLDADISAKNLTISDAVADNKIYDSTDDATVDFTNATLNGVETVDAGQVTIDDSGYTANFNNELVGTGKAVTVGGVDLDGAEATNYTVSQPSGLTADITAKGLTISGAAANNKTYDGDNIATVNFGGATLVGVETSDQDVGEVELDLANDAATFNNKNAGDGKPVTVTGVALQGTRATNYTVAQPTGLTADIDELDTTASFDANNKVYDGTTAATTSSRTVTSKVGSDDVALAGDATFADKDVDTGKTVTIASPSLTGTDALNYNLTTTSTDTADITAKNLTLPAAAANNKVYDSTDDATVNYGALSGIVAGDTDPGEVELDSRATRRTSTTSSWATASR